MNMQLLAFCDPSRPFHRFSLPVNEQFQIFELALPCVRSRSSSFSRMLWPRCSRASRTCRRRDGLRARGGLKGARSDVPESLDEHLSTARSANFVSQEHEKKLDVIRQEMETINEDRAWKGSFFLQGLGIG